MIGSNSEKEIELILIFLSPRPQHLPFTLPCMLKYNFYNFVVTFLKRLN